jgi:uncharacterized protein (TIGR02996 family)
VLIELDLDAARAAYDAGDAAAFDTAIAPLGTDLTLARVASYLAGQPHADTSTAVAMLRVIAAALVEPEGIAFSRHSSSALARVRDGQVLAGVQLLPGSNGWPELPRWHRELRKNRRMVDAWAATWSGKLLEARVVRAPPTAAPTRDLGALVAAILAAPGDLALRSVYADALLEAGDPRGELARVHCELATRASVAEDDPLLAAAFALETRCKPLYQREVGSASFHAWCGFLDHLAMTVPQLEKAVAGGVFERHPIRRLQLDITSAALLARADRLADRIPSSVAIELGRPSATRASAVELASSALALRAGEVRLINLDASDADWCAFVAASPATRLTLDRCRFGPALLEALGDPGCAPGLRALGVEHNDRVVMPVDLVGIATAWRRIGARASLREVALGRFPLPSDEAIIPALFAAGQLERFRCTDSDGDGTALRVIDQATARSLTAFDARITAAPLERLLPALPAVTELHLRLDRRALLAARTDAATVAALLARAPHLRRIHGWEPERAIVDAVPAIEFGYQTGTGVFVRARAPELRT